MTSPNEPQTIDDLMARPILELTIADIDDIITWHRAQRARRASGEKVTKPKVDLTNIMSKLIAKPTANEPKIKRMI